MTLILNDSERKRLLVSATHTYVSYLALDTMRKKVFCRRIDNSDETHYTLQNLCIAMLDAGQEQAQVSIAGQIFVVNISLRDGSTNTTNSSQHLITVARHGSPKGTFFLKELDKYTERDFAILLCEKPFVIYKQDSKYSSGVIFNCGENFRELVLGGPGKIDLYRSHLVNLHRIIIRIFQNKMEAMLVALATGSGKTFTQALWLQILHIANMNGIFTMPSNLVAQFRKDMDRLLPSQITGQITVFTGNGDNLIQLLQVENKSIVTSAENLLDNCYSSLMQTGGRRLFLTFDEQHAIARFESRYKKMSSLAEKYISLYLTATPSEKTYTACGSDPVAMMSPAQKKQAGQGQLSEIKTINTEFAADLNRKYTSLGKKFMLNELLAFFGGLFFPKISSAAVEAISLLPYQVSVLSQNTDGRVVAQMPMARKMLWLIDDNQSLVNFFLNFNKRDRDYDNPPKFYSDGAIVSFNPGKVKLSDAEDTSLYDKRQEDVFYAQIMGIDNKSRDYLWRKAKEGLYGQVRQNMLHGLIDYVLTDITGLSQIELNEIRVQNLSRLIHKFRSSILLRQKDTFDSKLNAKVGAYASNIICPLLEHICSFICEKLSYNDHNSVRQIFINDFLDYELFCSLLNDSKVFEDKFNKYCEIFQVVVVMANMEDAESPIIDSKPFSSLQRLQQEAFSEGRLNPNAKKRKRSAFDMLAGIMGYGVTDDFFSPQYLDDSITENIVDQLFKFGLIGIYISNKKSLGFNDPNLHTVVSLIENNLTMNANPAVQVQSYGRTRGLDETVKPAYIRVLGHKVKPSFDLKILDENQNYYPEYFRAHDSYNQEFIKILGKELAKSIIDEYTKSSTANFDYKKFKRKTFVLIIEKLSVLNINNTFDIQLSRAQLSEVLIVASSEIEEEIYRIQHPYILPNKIKFFASFVKGIFTTINFPKDKVTFFRLKMAERSLLKTQSLSPLDKIYLKIIRSNLTIGTFHELALVMTEIGGHAIKLFDNFSRKSDDDDFEMISDMVARWKTANLEKLEVSDILEDSNRQLLIDSVKFVSYLMINSDRIINKILNYFSPVLFNPEFIRNIDIALGELDANDVACIIEIFCNQQKMFKPSNEIAAKLNDFIGQREAGDPSNKSFTKASDDFFVLIDCIRQRNTDGLVLRLKAWLFNIQWEVFGVLIAKFTELGIDTKNILEIWVLLSSIKGQVLNDAMIYKNLSEKIPTTVEQLKTAVAKDQNFIGSILQTPTLSNLQLVGLTPLMISQMLSDSFFYFHRCDLKLDKLDEPGYSLSALSPVFKEDDMRLPHRQLSLFASLAKNMVYTTERLDRLAQLANDENISALKNIKENVLKGVWWKLKYSTWSVSIKRSFNNFVFAITEGALYIWRGIKSCFSEIKKFVLRIGKSDGDSQLELAEKYEEKYTADFTQKLNSLLPISQQTILQENCPLDATVPLLNELNGDSEPEEPESEEPEPEQPLSLLV